MQWSLPARVGTLAWPGPAGPAGPAGREAGSRAVWIADFRFDRALPVDKTLPGEHRTVPHTRHRPLGGP